MDARTGNPTQLLQALGEFEIHDNKHRPHRTLRQAAPLRPLPEPITEQAQARTTGAFSALWILSGTIVPKHSGARRIGSTSLKAQISGAGC